MKSGLNESRLELSSSCSSSSGFGSRASSWIYLLSWARKAWAGTLRMSWNWAGTAARMATPGAVAELVIFSDYALINRWMKRMDHRWKHSSKHFKHKQPRPQTYLRLQLQRIDNIFNIKHVRNYFFYTQNRYNRTLSLMLLYVMVLVVVVVAKTSVQHQE